jgi:hypothetical protein
VNTRLSIAACAALLATALPAAAHTVVYTTPLSAEGNPSPATGTATITIDEHALTLQVTASFQDLQTPATMAHIHCCQPSPTNSGVAIPFADFPTGVTSGSYSKLIDLSLAGSWNGSFLAANGGTTDGAFDALLEGLEYGEAYFNLHTTGRPAGEIRGYLAPVPEPETYALMLLGLGATVASAARRRAG